MVDASACNLLLLQSLSMDILSKEKVAAFLSDVRRFHDIKNRRALPAKKKTSPAQFH